jgi:glucose-6-phosphate isomerase
MLRLEINSDITGFLQELQDMMNGHASLLAKTQRGDPAYKDSLGWLDTGICAGERELERIGKKAAQIRMRADAFVLIGVGGSNNAARSVIEGVAHRSGCDVIYAGNTLHPRALREMLQKLDGRDFYIDCIAKNFETLEPASAFRVLRQYMDSRYGAFAAERVIATGTPGSSLWRLCQEEGYDFFDFPETVGGRYSAVTNVGLLPMAAAGIDVRELVKGANDMQMQLRSLGPQENPAYRYACLRRLFDRHGYHMEMLSSFEPELR